MTYRETSELLIPFAIVGVAVSAPFCPPIGCCIPTVIALGTFAAIRYYEPLNRRVMNFLERKYEESLPEERRSDSDDLSNKL